MTVIGITGHVNGVFSTKTNLRQVMITAATILLLVLLCAAPAAASAADAVKFGGGSYSTAADLAAAINAVEADTVSVSGDTLTLQKDLNITGTISITGKMTILGDGHTIWRGGKEFYLISVTGAGDLTLGNGETSGNLTIDGQGTPFEGYGGLIYVGENAQFRMDDGVNLTNNTVTRISGSGVHVDGGTFTMSGGTISGNTVSLSGGGVYVQSGTFTMSGGTISGNTATSYYGGGVFVSNGTFTMSGGEISGNTANRDGGGVYVSSDSGTFIMNGSAAVTADNDVYLVSGKKITVNGAMSGGGAQNITHAVTTAGTIVVSVDYSGGTAKSVKQYFKLNSSLASQQRIGLKAEGNDLKIGALVPEVDDPTVFVTPYTSTVANVSFNLTTASGATKVYVNLTPVSGGTPIATQYTGTISPGMGVVNHQVPGLTAGTAYTLNITPWSDTTEGTLFTTTYTAPSPVYTVTIQNDGHGTGSASPAGGAAGTAITLTSSPASGYQFKAWQVVQGSVSVSGNTFPMPAENVILKALFEPQTTPTPAPTQPRPTSSGNGGGGFGSTDSGSVSGTGQVSLSSTTGITAISFAKGTGGTVTINTKPTGVTLPPDSYGLYDVTGPDFEGYAQIEFSVPVAVLTDNGYTVNDVTLQHYTGGKWVKLDTTYLGEERGAANYIAATRSFSPLAITYEKDGAPTIKKVTPEPTGSTTAVTTVPQTVKTTPAVTPSQSGSTPAATTAVPAGGTPAPTLTQAPAPVFGVLAGLLAAAHLLRRKTVTLLVSGSEGMRYYKVHIRKNHTIDLGKLPDELRRQTWYCDEKRTGRWDFSEDTVVESITLYSGGYR